MDQLDKDIAAMNDFFATHSFDDETVDLDDPESLGDMEDEDEEDE